MIKTIIIGTCVIESHYSAIRHAIYLRGVEQRLRNAGHDVTFVYKSSHTKTNRRSRKAFRGVGAEEGAMILADVRSATGLKTTTDIHSASEAGVVGDSVDIIQIPHWLSRSTDIIEAAARASNHVSIKRGVNLSANDLKFSAEKALGILSKCNEVTLIERGGAFGDDIILDLRNIMKLVNDRRVLGPVKFPYNIGVDITHVSESRSQLIDFGKAVATTGVDTLFLETHEDPTSALCDGNRSIHLHLVYDFLARVLDINKLAGEDNVYKRCF